MAAYRVPDKTERWAIEVVARVTGSRVEFKDDGRVEGEVDAHILGADGPEALEVTTIADPDALAVELNRRAHELEELEGVAWRWDVRPAPDTSIKQLNRHGAILIRACERDGVTNPELLAPMTASEEEALRWHRTACVDFWAFPDATVPGVDVLPQGSGGAVLDDTDTLPSWIESTLQEGSPAKRVEKLRRSGLNRRHLFLALHDSGMPVSLFHAVAFGRTVPGSPLALPDGLTDLWLATRWREGGVRWWSPSGWTISHPFD